MSLATRPARDPWWVIGSAALVLHGIDPGPVGDIDLLMSARDAAALLAGRGIPVRPGCPDERFRSAVFGCWSASAVVVETMGGFELREANGWCPVLPVSRQPVECGGATIFVPARADLARLLRGFGRTKDLIRAAMLDPPA